VLRDLRPGKNLYLLATGTGLAPFISLIQDPETYERFEKVVLIHGVRWQRDLAYGDFIEKELPQHEFFADLVRDKLIYYPTVTREAVPQSGPDHRPGRQRPPVRRHRPAAFRPGTRPRHGLRQPGDDQGLLRPAR
jgi:ferredoxin-NADP reductase